MSDTIISFKNVSKSFGDNIIYQNLNLDIYKGETLCIIGGSGTGKSVMLKMLVGLLKPDSGEVLAFGKDVTQLDDAGLQDVRRQIAMLFQGGALFDSMSVAENIKFPLIEHGWGSQSEMNERVREVLNMVGLDNVEEKKPAELSGGMRKRVALARSIAVEPAVLLYDEPTTGLDPISIRRINGLIMSLQTKLDVTSLVVTHEMPSVFTIANRVAMVRDRHVAVVGTPEEIKRNTDPWVQQFIAGGDGVLEESQE